MSILGKEGTLQSNFLFLAYLHNSLSAICLSGTSQKGKEGSTCSKSSCTSLTSSPGLTHFSQELLLSVASFAADQGLWGSQSSVFAAPGLSSWGSQVLEYSSIVVAHRLSCSVTCGIFPDQGLNLYLLHWRAIAYRWATGEPHIQLCFNILMPILYILSFDWILFIWLLLSLR